METELSCVLLVIWTANESSAIIMCLSLVKWTAIIIYIDGTDIINIQWNLDSY